MAFLKYIVGFPVNHNDSFISEIVSMKEHVSEVYFSWGSMPSGRSRMTADEELIPFEVQKLQADALRRISDAGIGLNLLFNANCYGKDAQSREFFDGVGNLVDYFRRNYSLTSVTTASVLVARFIKENFENVDVRASVNMEIGTVEGISYVSDLFDSFYVKRELNRNLAALTKLRGWCDENAKQMYLLANSGCMNNCSAHIFHDNLVAHEAEIAAMDNGYQWRGICWDFLSDAKRRSLWLERTNFIRPEDIHLYESLTPAVKLATRVNSAPSRILGAYVSRKYRGSVMELLEPNHSGLFYPDYIENTNFDKDFGIKVLNCAKNCNECGYCRNTMQSACVKLAADPTLKV